MPPEVPAIPGNLCILPNVPCKIPRRCTFRTPAKAWSVALSLETYQVIPRYLTCGARPFFNASSADAKPLACANTLLLLCQGGFPLRRILSDFFLVQLFSEVRLLHLYFL